MKTCTVDRCDGKVVGKGYCSKHWQQYHKFGKIKERVNRDPNEIFIRDGVGIIVLYDKQNRPHAETLIDVEDIDRCKNIKWSVISMNPKHRLMYVVTNRVQVKKHDLISERLHAFLMGVKTNSEIHVDHKDGNTFNNQKYNLQIITNGQNQIKKRRQKNNTSGYRGVIWYKNYNCWAAQISFQRKHYNLGYHKTKEEAAIAYNKKAKELFGAFAVLNKIQ